MITWVSWSGKTTIQEILIKECGYTKPINFVTREPRNEKELDEYIFVSQDQFLRKVKNWDLAEYICYNWEFYWITNYIDYTKDNIIIVEPVGFAALSKKFRLEGKQFTSIFLDIDEKEQERRLWILRRESVDTIRKRKEDFKYFLPNGYDLVIDWTRPIRDIINIITNQSK